MSLVPNVYFVPMFPRCRSYLGRTSVVSSLDSTVTHNIKLIQLHKWIAIIKMSILNSLNSTLVDRKHSNGKTPVWNQDSGQSINYAQLIASISTLYGPSQTRSFVIPKNSFTWRYYTQCEFNGLSSFILRLIWNNLTIWTGCGRRGGWKCLFLHLKWMISGWFFMRP